jgi:hypothetical protein
VILDLGQVGAHGEGDGGDRKARSAHRGVGRVFLLANRSVGFISYGRRLFVEDAERGAQHYTRILEGLALATAEGDVDIGTLVTEESKRFGRHTTVVVVTPSTEEDWVGSLEFIAQRGVKVAAVILDAATFGSTKKLADGLRRAGGRRHLTYVVRRADELDTSLAYGSGTTSETMAGRAER